MAADVAPVMTLIPASLRAILAAGTLGSVTSTAAHAAASVARGGSAWQPFNATSHWRHGKTAAARRAPDLALTCTGAATHWLATIFWAAGFEAWLRVRPPRSRREAAAVAVASAAVAAFVDYRMTPCRYTPGWAFVLGRAGMGAGYAAMAAGLLAGRALAVR